MKFLPTINLWTLSEAQTKALQPGQWVSAGPMGDPRYDRGTFCGVKESGSVVVAWQGNARASKHPKQYRSALMAYARPSSGLKRSN